MTIAHNRRLPLDLQVGDRIAARTVGGVDRPVVITEEPKQEGALVRTRGRYLDGAKEKVTLRLTPTKTTLLL